MGNSLNLFYNCLPNRTALDSSDLRQRSDHSTGKLPEETIENDFDFEEHGDATNSKENEKLKLSSQEILKNIMTSESDSGNNHNTKTSSGKELEKKSSLGKPLGESVSAETIRPISNDSIPISSPPSTSSIDVVPIMDFFSDMAPKYVAPPKVEPIQKSERLKFYEDSISIENFSMNVTKGDWNMDDNTEEENKVEDPRENNVDHKNRGATKMNSHGTDVNNSNITTSNRPTSDIKIATVKQSDLSKGVKSNKLISIQTAVKGVKLDSNSMNEDDHDDDMYK